MGKFALMGNLSFQAYGVVGGRVDVILHVRVRGGRALPSPPPRAIEVSIDAPLDDAWGPHLHFDDPIEQFTSDDEVVEEDVPPSESEDSQATTLRWGELFSPESPR